LESCSHNVEASAQAAAAQATLAAGADEIDLLFAYGAFQAGNLTGARACIEAVKAACGEATLKVILESGAFTDMNLLRQAAELAVDAGADFLKTSSGVHAIGATPEAVQVLCDVSRAYAKQIGIKISGGVRSLEQAQDYMKLVANTLGLNWIEPNHFRFGTSKLVDELLETDTAASAVGY
jgi:deoxyribose-phosphate aldolase